MSTYYCPAATLGEGMETRQGVRLGVRGDRIDHIEPGTSRPDGSAVLGDLVVPGFANCHSHVFHRALRGRTHTGGGSFWTWREQMYALAAVLDPDLLHELAVAAYAEMVAAGFSAVGEFHYLHHGPGGVAYADPNAMGEAVIEAARTAGLRIALLDTCYLSAGFGAPPEGVQCRFDDGDADRWAERVEDLHARYAHAADVVVGVAIHSVRAVPNTQLDTLAQWAHEHGAPLHVHLSEQPAENEACLAHHGMTPTELLGAHGVWGPRTTAVHATHLTDSDIAILGGQQAFVCLCPTTERDLADGVGPSAKLREAGARLTLGSDSHAVIDPFEEARAIELDHRLVTGERGIWPAHDLLRAGTTTGHESLGFADAGAMSTGQLADLVGVTMESIRTAGALPGPDAAVFAASAADVTATVVGGQRLRAEAASGLGRAIGRCWERVDEEQR